MSPRRAGLRKRAFIGQVKQTKTMKARATKADDQLILGDAIQELLHHVDQTKVDGTTFNAVVVEILPSGQVRCATAVGVLDRSYAQHVVSCLPGICNIRKSS
jgi:hypothetical protein